MTKRSSDSGRVTFRDKAARVYSPKTTYSGNTSISVDRDFTVRFSDAESVDLEKKQSAMRDRLTGSSRKGG